MQYGKLVLLLLLVWQGTFEVMYKTVV